MAYSKTIDERYHGSFLQYDAGALDAPSTLNEVAVLASGSTGYGFLTDTHTLRDIDIYSLGILDAGDYSVDVDGYTWDYTEFGYGSVSKFQVLNSYGSVVDTSYGTYSNIDFTVAASSTYYVKIEGPLFGTEQYSVSYTKTGDLASTNTPAVFSGASYTGSITVGETITASIDYYDLDGYSSITQSEGLFTGWYTQDSSGISEFLGGAFDDTITLSEDMVGKTLLFSKAFTDGLSNTEFSAEYVVGVVKSANSLPTGSVTISGSATVGETLTVVTSGLSDADGLGSYSYQWLQDGVDISNASNTTYELTDNDLGTTISVSVSYIDDGGTAEKITSFASEPVGTALFLDEHSNDAGWQFYAGTDGSDLIFGQSSSVYSSGVGDDTFVSGDDAEFQAFVGGPGTDQYTITKPGVMAVAEVNDGSPNVISASGIGFTYETTFVLTVNDGQHLIVEDTLSGQAVWLIDWADGEFTSSKAILADGEYTAQFIAENLSVRPNYLGDFSWSELTEMGANIPNDMPELIADAKQWALGADTSQSEIITINLNDTDGTLTAAELETWVGLTGTAPAGSELTLVATLDVTGGVDELIITTAANGDWSFTGDDINGTPYDGTYTLSLTARDTSGTILGTVSSEISFASGNIAPSDGFGTHTYSDGGVYVGEFLAGDREGQGTITWADGTVYSGEWQDDYWSGQGTVSYPSGDVYVGEFLAGDMEGQGTYTFDNGTVYTGTSLDNWFNGQGTMTWTNGDVYVGSWVADARTGQGTYTWADGSAYEGTWVDGDREGQGTYTWADGAVHVGEWVDNYREGQGTYTGPDGDVYVSEWVDDAPNGQSTVTFSYVVFTGEFLNGLPNGEGTYSFKYGKVYNAVIDIGSTGEDTLIGDESSNALFGEEGNDIIEANAGDDILNGGDGDDTLNGGDGDDTLVGGDGNDALTGGSGSDAFLFQGAFGHDTITDYNSNEDILEFYAGDGSALNISDLIETMNTDGNRVLSTADGLASVTMDGVGFYEKVPTPTIDLNDTDGVITTDEVVDWAGLSGTAYPGTTVTLVSTYQANGASESYTAIANDQGVWALTQDDVGETPPNGVFSLTVTATDSAGNVSDAATETLTLNLNSTPTGAVTISGTAIVGNTLTAVTSAISDDDGLGNFSYQWLQDGIEIVGATSKTFLVAPDVVGGDLSVAANYIDGAGNFESLTSLTIDNVGIAFDPDLTETFTIPVLHFLNNDTTVEDVVTGEDIVQFIANSSAELELFDSPAFDYSYAEYGDMEINGDLSSIRLTYGDETFAFDGSKFSFYDSANPSGQGGYYSPFYTGRLESNDYYYDIGTFGFGRDDMDIRQEGLLILLGSDDPDYADGVASAITDQASFDEFLLSIQYLVGPTTLIPADVSYGPGQAGLLNTLITETLAGTSESDEFEFALMEQGGHGYIALRDFDSLEDELLLTSYTPSKIIKTLDGSGYDKFVFTEDSDVSTLVIETAEVASSLKLSNLANKMLKLASGDLLVNEHGELSLSSTKEIDGVKVDGISSFKTDIKLADDTNASDPISIGDVIAQIKHIIGMKELKSYAHEAGDTNNDGDVNLTDVLATIKHIIGREELNTFDLVTDNGFAVNALDAESKGNLKLVINGDADQSHADWDILASLPL